MRRFRSLAASSLLLCTLSFAAPVLAAPQTYEIDPVHSRVEFTIRHMFSKVTGSFGAFKGSVVYDAAAPASSSANVEIDASSIDTNNDQRDHHLKSPDFFDVAKYPTSTFTTTSIKAGGDKGATHTITGDLDLHGVKKSISFPATIKIAADAVTATAEFSINRKDFNINYNRVIEAGGVVVGDEVKINIEIEAIEKKG